MLTIIGLMPASYALKMDSDGTQIATMSKELSEAANFIERFGDDQKQQGITSAHSLGDRYSHLKSVEDIPPADRPAVRNDFNRVEAQLMKAGEAKGVSDEDKKRIKAIHSDLTKSTHYVPWWVRILSALCLGIGTMVGYRRIVKTLGERLGKSHLVPAQGASAELVAAALIGFDGLLRLSREHNACRDWRDCGHHGCLRCWRSDRDRLADYCGVVAYLAGNHSNIWRAVLFAFLIPDRLLGIPCFVPGAARKLHGVLRVTES
jgi:Phosphate transporter family